MTDEERQKIKEYRKNMTDEQKQRYKENKNKRNNGKIITIIKGNDHFNDVIEL